MEEPQEGEDEDGENPEEFPEQNINDMDENVEENQFVKPHEEPEEFKIEEGMLDDEQNEPQQEEQPMDIDQMEQQEDEGDEEEDASKPPEEKPEGAEDIPEDPNQESEMNEDGMKDQEQVVPEDNPEEPLENAEEFHNANQVMVL